MGQKSLIDKRHNTVVYKYVSVKREEKDHQSELQMEQRLVEDLKHQGYEYIKLVSLNTLKNNLRQNLEKLNNYIFINEEWDRFYYNVINGRRGILARA